MCERCAQLEEELAWLKGERDIEVSLSRVDLMRRRFRLEPAGARLLLTLYDAQGRVVPHLALEEACSRDPDMVASNSLKVHVHRARNALGDGVIETAPGMGYRMTPLGRARVYQALTQADYVTPPLRTIPRREDVKRAAEAAAGTLRKFSWETAQ